MKLSSKNLARLLILLVVGLYSFVVMMLTKEFTPCFWVNYCFVLLAPIATLLFTFKKSKAADSLAFNLVYFRYIFAYAVIELVLGTILMYTNMALKYVFLIQVPILVIVVILIVYFSMFATSISNNLETQRAKVDNLNMIRVKLNVVKNSTNDLEVQKQLDRLISEVQYSDYNSIPQVQPIEQQMVELIDEMKYATPDVQLVQIKKLNILLNERNQTILMLKR